MAPPHLTDPVYGPDGSALAVEDEGSALVDATALDFRGSGVTVTDQGSGVARVTIPGGGGGGSIDIADEGVTIDAPATLNFAGAGVTAAGDATTVTVTIPATAIGAASSADNQIARFDGVTGKTIQSGANTPTITDAGDYVPVGAGKVDTRDVSVDGATLDAAVIDLAQAESDITALASAVASADAALDARIDSLETDVPAIATDLAAHAAEPHPHSAHATLVGGTVPIGEIPTGATSSDVCIGNDARLSDTRTPTDGSVTTAKIVAGAVTGTEINAAIKDPAAGTAGLRTLSTTATTACAGNDARLSDTRTPTDGSVTTAKIAAGAVTGTEINAAIKDAAAGTASLRTLSTTATTACAGNDARLGRHLIARCATIADDTLSGTGARDGVTPSAGDIVLVRQQTTAADNGVYTVAAGAWSRVSETMADAILVSVAEGGKFKNSLHQLAEDGTTWECLSATAEGEVAHVVQSTGAQSTIVLSTTCYGMMCRANRRIRVSHIVARNTAVTSNGTYAIGVYQVPGGHMLGTARKIASVTGVAPGASPQTQDTAISESSAEIEAGVYYVLYGRDSAGGSVTMRTQVTGLVDLLTTNILSGTAPAAFTAAGYNANALPSTVDPGADFTASGNDVSLVVRFRRS